MDKLQQAEKEMDAHLRQTKAFLIKKIGLDDYLKTINGVIAQIEDNKKRHPHLSYKELGLKRVEFIENSKMDEDSKDIEMVLSMLAAHELELKSKQ